MEVKLLWLSEAFSYLWGDTGGEAGRRQSSENHRIWCLCVLIQNWSDGNLCYQHSSLRWEILMRAPVMSHGTFQLSVNTCTKTLELSVFTSFSWDLWHIKPVIIVVFFGLFFIMGFSLQSKLSLLCPIVTLFPWLNFKKMPSHFRFWPYFVFSSDLSNVYHAQKFKLYMLDLSHYIFIVMVDQNRNSQMILKDKLFFVLMCVF